MLDYWYYRSAYFDATSNLVGALIYLFIYLLIHRLSQPLKQLCSVRLNIQ